MQTVTVTICWVLPRSGWILLTVGMSTSIASILQNLRLRGVSGFPKVAQLIIGRNLSLNPGSLIPGPSCYPLSFSAGGAGIKSNNPMCWLGHFTCIILFQPHHNPFRCLLWHSPLDRRRNWGSERFHTLSEMNDKSFTCRCAEKPPQIASLGLEFRLIVLSCKNMDFNLVWTEKKQYWVMMNGPHPFGRWGVPAKIGWWMWRIFHRKFRYLIRDNLYYFSLLCVFGVKVIYTNSQILKR